MRRPVGLDVAAQVRQVLNDRCCAGIGVLLLDRPQDGYVLPNGVATHLGRQIKVMNWFGGVMQGADQSSQHSIAGGLCNERVELTVEVRDFEVVD